LDPLGRPFYPALKLVLLGTYPDGKCIVRPSLIPGTTYITAVLSGRSQSNETNILSAALTSRWFTRHLNLDKTKSLIERCHVTVKIPCKLTIHSSHPRTHQRHYADVAEGVSHLYLSCLTHSSLSRR
ncbi:hypothetical protein CLAIMM_04708, partial [Cladophialophora immunda]